MSWGVRGRVRAVLEGGRFQQQEGAGPGGGLGKLPALEV